MSPAIEDISLIAKFHREQCIDVNRMQTWPAGVQRLQGPVAQSAFDAQLFAQASPAQA